MISENNTSNDRLWTFFLLTFIFSWLLWLPGLLTTYDVLKSSQTLDLITGILQWVGGIGPSTVALFLIIRHEGKEGVKTLFKRVLDFKLGIWYLPLFLLLPLTVIVAHLLNVLLFDAVFPTPDILSEPWWILVLFAVFFILQFSEELGWRGFALDRLQQRWGALSSSIVLGVIWAVWHLPMFLSNGFGQHDNHLPYGQFFITIVLVSVLITWLQNNTNGSLVPAFVMHALIALSGEVLPLIETSGPNVGDYTAWTISNALLSLVVIVVVYFWGGRNLSRNTADDKKKKTYRLEHLGSLLLVIGLIMILSIFLAGCGPSAQELELVDYTPLEIDGDWEVSTPEEQGLNPDLVAELYYDAAQQDTLYSVLVIKDGTLIAEGYFNEGSVDQKPLLQSASKSYISALVWIAIEQQCISGIDARLVDFFPEIAGQMSDPRKEQITIEQMLQMRSGYPDEETNQAYMDALYWGGGYPSLIEEFPLVCEPGTCFNYSNLTYIWLAILLSRSCEADLRSFAQEHLFGPIDTEVGDWLKDREGNYIGSGGIHATARDAARFGQLYLDGGEYEGTQIISSEWVQNSLQSYSERAKDYGRSLVFKDMGYGYGWWTATVDDHDFSFAWGHGGQLIVLLEDLDMVVVTTADPFFAEHSGNSWKHESAIMNMVGDFIKTLPGE